MGHIHKTTHNLNPNASLMKSMKLKFKAKIQNKILMFFKDPNPSSCHKILKR